MEFYSFLKELVGYVPDGSGLVREAFHAFLPYFLMACALFTAFFALKCAAWWCGLTFFMLGSTVTSQWLLPHYSLNDFQYWLFFGVSIAVGILCAYFSKYLFRAQLGASTFLTVLAALPSFATQVGAVAAHVTSAVIAAAFVYLFVKYRYLVTIVTTSFTGSLVFWDVIEAMTGVQHKMLWAVLTGIFALFSQTLINHDKLAKTYLELRKKLAKTVRGIEYVEEKAEHLHHHGEKADAEENETEDNSAPEAGATDEITENSQNT